MAELTSKKKDRDVATTSTAPPAASQSRHSGLLSWVANLVVLSLYRAITTVGSPVGGLIAFYLWCGRGTFNLIRVLQRSLLRGVGWLSGPAFAPDNWIRIWAKYHVNLDIKRWHLSVALLVGATVVTTLLRRLRQRFDSRLRAIARIRAAMQNAKSYKEWHSYAAQLDALGVRDPLEAGMREGKLYDRQLLLEKMAHLRRVAASGSVHDLMVALRTDLIRNVANITKSQLHEYFWDVPDTIKGYLEEVRSQLQRVAEWPESELPLDEKVAYLQEVRHTFGRSALLLSGGGGLGAFHIGVVKVLYEQNLLPRVMAGSSVGSIVAAIICTRTDAELASVFARLELFDFSFFNNSRAMEMVNQLVNKGSLHDHTFLASKLRHLLGDTTFQEAYERTGRVLNISVCPADTNEPSRLLNYLTAPHVCIWSAVACSSAFPYLFSAQHLWGKDTRRGGLVRVLASETGNDGAVERRWRDGSLEADLPAQLLGEMFHCNNFIVSQCNPHIVPLLYAKRGLSRKWGNLMETEFKHRCAQLQLMLPESMTGWTKLFTQSWEGDITMVLPSRLWNIGKAVTNPTPLDLVAATRAGEVATWEKLSAIECNSTIEATLDACLATLTARSRERPLKGLRSRIPSWMHLNFAPAKSGAVWGEPVPEDGPALLGAPTPLPATLAAVSAATAATAGRAGAGAGPAGPGGARLSAWAAGDVADSVADYPLQGSSGYSRSVSDDGSRGPSSDDADALHLAQMDCCDSSVEELFSALFPVAHLSARLSAVGAANGGGDALDVIAP